MPEYTYDTMATIEEDDNTAALLRDYCNTQHPDREEERQLALRAKAGDRSAFDELVIRNMRLVVDVACRFQHRGLPLCDLIQEGSIGLMRAIHKFEPERGNKLATLAVWWIRQQINRAIMDKADIIRKPVHVKDAFCKINNKWYEQAQNTGSYMNKEEIAIFMGLNKNYVANAIKAVRTTPLSLDVLCGDEDSTMGDFVEDPNAVMPEEEASASLLKEQIAKLMEDSLTERERLVIETRYGMGDGIKKTLDEIAKTIPNQGKSSKNQFITRERVRQIEREAMGKLRAKAYKMGLREWLKA